MRGRDPAIVDRGRPRHDLADGDADASAGAARTTATIFRRCTRRTCAPACSARTCIATSARSSSRRRKSGAARTATRAKSCVPSYTDPSDAPDAAVTIMRAWEHGWIAQHFVDTNPEINGATGKLQTAYLDHLVPRPDGRYLLFFIKTDNRVMNCVLAAVLRQHRHARRREPQRRRAVVARAATRRVPSRAGRRPTSRCAATSRMTSWCIARAVQRRLGPHAAAALSMVPGRDRAPRHARALRACRSRAQPQCDIVTRGGTATYAVLEERSTPGPQPDLDAQLELDHSHPRRARR